MNESALCRFSCMGYVLPLKTSSMNNLTKRLALMHINCLYLARLVEQLVCSFYMTDTKRIFSSRSHLTIFQANILQTWIA